MDRTGQQWQITEGTDVVGSDGEKVGKVVAAESSYIVVEKGFFFPTDYYIPMSAIGSSDGDKIYLSVSKDEALNQGWDQPMTDSGTVVETSYAQGAGAVSDFEGDRMAGVTPTGLADSVDMGTTDTTIRDQGVYDDTARFATDQTYDTTTTTGSMETDTLRVPVHEEELTATTRPVERGQVRIEKEVIAEERTIDVPVSEERVTITRRAVNQETGVDDMAFQEDTIEIPLRSEEVEVQKRNRVVEEIDIAKDTVQRTEHVTDTVRREEVRVDEATTGATSRFVDTDTSSSNR